MRKVRWKQAGILLACMAVILIWGAALVSADETNTGQAVSLTLNCIYQEQPVQGIKFNIYCIATYSDDGELDVNPLFSGYSITRKETNASGLRDMAETLDGYSQRDTLPIAFTGETDQDGILSVPTSGSMEPGVYLCEAEQLIRDKEIYTVEPFFVTLPQEDENGNAEYQVSLKPKIAREEEPETVERSVMKVWVDDETELGTTGSTTGTDTESTTISARPEEITVQLLRDGKVYEEQKLNAANNWRYTWETLEASEEWLVVEKDVPEDYTVITDLQDTTFVITNTKEEESAPTPTPSPTPEVSVTPNPSVTPEVSITPAESITPVPSDGSTPSGSSGGTPASSTDTGKLPQTGLLWWPVPILAVAGLLLFLAGWMKHRKDQ